MYVRGLLLRYGQQFAWHRKGKAALENGITDIDYYLGIADKINYDRSELEYFNYSLEGILTLAKAALISGRKQMREQGAHQRSDSSGNVR